MVDRRGTVRHMSHVFNARTRPLPVVNFPPSASSVPTVCGWSVCVHRLTEAYRVTDAKTNSPDVVQLEMTAPWPSEYYIHSQTN